MLPVRLHFAIPLGYAAVRLIGRALSCAGRMAERLRAWLLFPPDAEAFHPVIQGPSDLRMCAGASCRPLHSEAFHLIRDPLLLRIVAPPLHRLAVLRHLVVTLAHRDHVRAIAGR
jgi:hypothetical protein